ncbi:hypothetical protein L6303_01940 [archaeon]|nr:hypothetical protein [Nanoarchaeota archaeon]MBU4300696.1 hypothetical protein [Nanoarchaeota archaeon]MBU4451791.1 hypothetical protein [Nanoarchaeota archaeon]MCG2723480.1 hypothetical protein [archaeon]
MKSKQNLLKDVVSSKRLMRKELSFVKKNPEMRNVITMTKIQKSLICPVCKIKIHLDRNLREEEKYVDFYTHIEEWHPKEAKEAINEIEIKFLKERTIEIEPETKKAFYSLKKEADTLKRDAEKLGTFKEKIFFYPLGDSPKKLNDDGFIRHLLYLQKRQIKMVKKIYKVFGKRKKVKSSM